MRYIPIFRPVLHIEEPNRIDIFYGKGYRRSYLNMAEAILGLEDLIADYFSPQPEVQLPSLEGLPIEGNELYLCTTTLRWYRYAHKCPSYINDGWCLRPRIYREFLCLSNPSCVYDTLKVPKDTQDTGITLDRLLLYEPTEKM